MKFFNHNWFAILYFNFKMLPIRQAIHLPIDFCHKIKFNRLSGKVVINEKIISRGMICFGAQGSDMFDGSSTIIDIAGSLIIKGSNIRIGRGSLLRIEQNATIELHDKVTIGARNIILCEQAISIQQQTISSWNCQFMDTDTHSIINLDNGEILPRTFPIRIGERCWIGNNVLINKGTILPNDIIVASYSLCNKDYSNRILNYSIIGGIPAKKIAENRKRNNDKL